MLITLHGPAWNVIFDNQGYLWTALNEVRNNFSLWQKNNGLLSLKTISEEMIDWMKLTSRKSIY